MILIAESGSTKTQWVVLDNGKEHLSFFSLGLNPYIQKPIEIQGIIEKEVGPHLKDLDINELFFYGAACSSVENCALMASIIKPFIKNATIHIEHDLMAAAVGLFGKESGIAAILGTGSNSCVYNGLKIVEGVPSLGYILGDEGSGGHFGKTLMTDYIYMKLPTELHKKLTDEFGLTKEFILNKIYKEPSPNRWLASFGKFIKGNLNDEYCRELVKDSFQQFFDVHINQYKNFREYSVGAVGSIAWNFTEILKEVAIEYEFRLDRVLQSPLKGLIEYHTAH